MRWELHCRICIGVALLHEERGAAEKTNFLRYVHVNLLRSIRISTRITHKGHQAYVYNSSQSLHHTDLGKAHRS